MSKGKSNLELGTLYSSCNYMVSVPYGNSKIIIPSRGKVVGVDKSKLGVLPKGVIFESKKD